MKARAWLVVVAAAAALALAAVALAKGAPGMMGPQRALSVRSFQGYYDGHKDTFLGTDTSSKTEAAMEHINFSTKLAASLKTSEEIYLFSGKAAAGQLPVFSSEPGEKTYTPLWREEIVTWKVGTTPALIVRDDRVGELKKKGMIRVRETSTVLDCPIVKVGKGGSS
jgi:hypothetical protein